MLSALPRALQSSAAVQELGTPSSEPLARCGCPWSLLRSARERQKPLFPDADWSRCLLCAAEWQWEGALGVPVCPAHPYPKNSQLPLCFPNRNSGVSRGGVCLCPLPSPRPWGQWLWDTYTSTPVECRELCQFTGRNSTRPTCCCSWAFLKCSCSMLRETLLKSFTGKEKNSYGEPPGSGASPWHQQHLIR